MQIEGAFVQGLGWVALEELKWGDAAHKWIPPGCLYTCGPGSYKIPSINDVPLKFDVSLLKVEKLPISHQYLMGVWTTLLRVLHYVTHGICFCETEVSPWSPKCMLKYVLAVVSDLDIH